MPFQASHGADIPFVFGNTEGPDLYWDNKISYPFTESEKALSDTMQTFWGQLAHLMDHNNDNDNDNGNGNGNGNGSPTGPTTTTSSSSSSSTTTLKGPNGEEWPEFGKNGTVLTLRTHDQGGLTTTDHFNEDACLFWEKNWNSNSN